MFGRGSQDGLLDEVARLRQRVAELETERARDLRLDSLTGLLSPRTFRGRLSEEVERARRYQRALSMAIIALDDFAALLVELEVVGEGTIRAAGASMGVAALSRGMGPETLLASARLALARARSVGGGRAVLAAGAEHLAEPAATPSTTRSRRSRWRCWSATAPPVSTPRR